jgi:hypothetical protein
MSSTVVLLFASKHRRKMSARTSAVYKYVKEHYPTCKEHLGAHEHQVENPCGVVGVTANALSNKVQINKIT